MLPDRPRRFVVQHHVLSADHHWDLMLEGDERLATWQLSVPPENCTGGPVAAVRIADHRKVYLDYEGPVSGGRGSVSIVDSGTYRLESHSPEEWSFSMEGRILRGAFRLIRMPDEPGRWELRPVDPP